MYITDPDQFTAVRAMPGARNAWLTSVVLPLPRKPVRMSTATVRTYPSVKPAHGRIAAGNSQHREQHSGGSS